MISNKVYYTLNIKSTGGLMKTERNILIAFILNLVFSVFEFVGGLYIGSVAIVSDALHDIGDAMSIGMAFFFEKKSKRLPDETHTYGYGRYSVLGGLITTMILLVGSGVVVYNAVTRIINPTEINYNGMLIFAIIGVAVNLCAAFFTREGDSLNQKAVNLHMLEDVLGWIIVLVGAIVMRFTDFVLIDSILSIVVAAVILINAVKNLKEVLDLFLEKTPHGISVQEVKAHLSELEGVVDTHHVHIWSMDGQSHFATMHVVARGDGHAVKERIRRELKEHGIGHVTLELETEGEYCAEPECRVATRSVAKHHHHHHH